MNEIGMELKQRRRQKWGRRVIKNELMFYQRISVAIVQYASRSKSLLRLNVQWQRSVPNGKTKISRHCSRSSDFAILVSSRCCFAQDGKEMYKDL